MEIVQHKQRKIKTNDRTIKPLRLLFLVDLEKLACFNIFVIYLLIYIYSSFDNPLTGTILLKECRNTHNVLTELEAPGAH